MTPWSQIRECIPTALVLIFGVLLPLVFSVYLILELCC